MTGCICHQASHTCKLFDLLIRTTGSGVGHHEDVVVLVKTVKQGSCKLIVSLLPGFNNLFITLFLCDQTTFVVLCNFIYDILCILDHLRFLRRHSHIGNGNRHGSTSGVLITCGLDSVKYLSCLGSSMSVDNFFQNLFQLLFTYKEVNLKQKFVARNASVHKSKILRKNLVEQETSQCGFYIAGKNCSIRHCLCAANLDL